MAIKQFKLVHQQAVSLLDKLSQQMAQAIQIVEAEKQQVTQLHQYKYEYLSTIQHKEKNWTASKTNHYRHFCYQIGEIIEGQQSKLENSEAQLEHLRLKVLQQQQKVKALESFIQREELAILAKENVALQKESDEFSLRNFRLPD